LTDIEHNIVKSPPIGKKPLRRQKTKSPNLVIKDIKRKKFQQLQQNLFQEELITLSRIDKSSQDTDDTSVNID